MNELMVDYGNGNWLYYQTAADNIKDAYTNMLSNLEAIGINFDNMHFCEMLLRDGDDDIDALIAE